MTTTIQIILSNGSNFFSVYRIDEIQFLKYLSNFPVEKINKNYIHSKCQSAGFKIFIIKKIKKIKK